jgi:uncharacterized protein
MRTIGRPPLALALACVLFILPGLSQAQSMLSLVRVGNAQTVKAAIAQGSPLCDRDEQGATPLLIAAGCNPDPAVVTELLAGGAKLEERDQFEMTPLMRAAASNPNPEVIAALLDAGANIEDQDQFGLTPLIYAAGTNNQPEIIKLLISSGANVKCKDSFGMTAFDYLRQNARLRSTVAYFYLRNAK